MAFKRNGWHADYGDQNHFAVDQNDRMTFEEYRARACIEAGSSITPLMSAALRNRGS